MSAATAAGGPRYILASDGHGAVRVWQRRAGRPDRLLARRFASFAEAADYRAALEDGRATLHPDDPLWRIAHGMG